jgi:hypothetical protein
MYQQHGFLAEALAGACLPRVIRDYRIETICESAFAVPAWHSKTARVTSSINFTRCATAFMKPPNA